MDSLIAQVMVDILNEEMSMPNDTVWIRDQNKLFPNDKRLYLVVGMVGVPSIISNVSYMQAETITNQKTGATAVVQHQISQVQTRENIMVDVISRSNDALTRNMEVIMAMQSIYAQQQQELNNCKIFRSPISFLNTSVAEGGSTLNRYSITFAAMVWYRKDKLLNSPLGDYYDDFKTRADDYKTIDTNNPIAQFEIAPNTPPPL